LKPRVTSVGLIIPPDLTGHFEYPHHIERTGIDALPAAPGVYLFHNRRGAPVYIGKSVNIRSRVLSHLRAPYEPAMLQETCRIEFLRTAGEIGALLQESQLIKKHKPVYNAQLKYLGETFAIRLDAGGRRPQVVGSYELDAGAGNPLYGLFPSRGAAMEGLRLLIRQHMLCPALCGLETTTRGRACFARQIGRCKGACIGQESKEEHDARLRAALARLQAEVWPYPGPVGIIEEGDGRRQTHVVDRWSYLGSLEGRRKKLKRPAKHVIDIDTYKILAKPMLSGQLDIVVMNAI
jgi:excinuclease Cho